MATFFIEQFGCRATQADAAAIERQLLDRGYQLSRDARTADVVVVNTCTVTAAADLQARQAIRSIHRHSPGARVIVTGCYAQRAPDEIAALEGVSWVVGNSHKPEIPRLVAEMQPVVGAFARGVFPVAENIGFIPLAAVQGNSDLPASWAWRAEILTGDMRKQTELLVAAVEGGEAGHTRPVLKIQDGCDRSCSYCVIPQVRGRSRSLAPEAAITEIRKLCDGGAREIVLSGIDLGNYGRDLTPRVRLGDLLQRVLEDTSTERLRVSSIEPMDVTEDLIAIFAASDRLARHFHMPLQSGSDRILRAMHRWYRAEHYARRAELVHERLPDASIGADVIAGFPGETEEDHGATMNFIEARSFTYLHVFSYSVRPGTGAATLPHHVVPATIKRRAQELRALSERKSAEFHSSQSGRTLSLLTLRHSDSTASDGKEWTPALSSNFLKLRLAGSWQANQLVNAVCAAAPQEYLQPQFQSDESAIAERQPRQTSVWPS